MLSVIKNFCTVEAGRAIGKPFAVHGVLEKVDAPNPEAYEVNAHRSSVIPWHLWAKQHAEEGIMWRRANNRYLGETRQHIVPLTNLCRVEHSTREIDIREIRAASSSKADLTQYEVLHWLATGAGKDVLEKHPDAPSSIAKFMSHDQIRLGREGAVDTVCDFRWGSAQGLVLSNEGGSHHLAAAIYLAHCHSTPYRLMANHATYELNELQAQKLQKQVGFAYLPEDPTARFEIEKAIENFGADYGVMSMRGWPERGTLEVVALPLNCKRSRAVFNAFLAHAWPTLNDLLSKSVVNTERNNAPRRVA